MSKLDNIILECANKVLAGKEETLGDYIDPTKQQIKDLMLEIIGKDDAPEARLLYPEAFHATNGYRIEMRQKVGEL